MATKKTSTSATTETKRAASKSNKFYNEMTLEYMMNYIDEHAPKDKEWFKSVAIDSKGKYQHLVAKKEFCTKYMPEKLPTKKEKIRKSDILANW